MSPRWLSYCLPSFRGFEADARNAGAFTTWMFTSCTIARPKQMTMITPSHRIRRPISSPPVSWTIALREKAARHVWVLELGAAKPRKIDGQGIGASSINDNHLG